MNTFNPADALSQLPPFSRASQGELRRLAAASLMRHLTRGEVLIPAAAPCMFLYFVLRGQIKLSVVSPSGQEKVVDVAGPGATLGETLIYSSEPHIVSAQSLTDSVVLAIDAAAVLAAMRRESELALAMLALISRRLNTFMRDVQIGTLQSGVQRVIGYLLRDLDQIQRVQTAPLSIALPVSKATIASWLSITPEYFSRVLHGLETDGLIRIEKRIIHISNVARLAQHNDLTSAADAAAHTQLAA
jgi:CRP-like cAMP-binding protein